VHDPSPTKSGASVNVQVGSLQDPDQKLGLAHFLEHMLFMGTKDFPKHNEFSEFLSKESGNDNAFTDLEDTNYYFCCKNEAFLTGLKMFS
jgi:insulysin